MEQTSLAFRKDVHFFCRVRCPPRSPCGRHIISTLGGVGEAEGRGGRKKKREEGEGMAAVAVCARADFPLFPLLLFQDDFLTKVSVNIVCLLSCNNSPDKIREQLIVG